MLFEEKPLVDEPSVRDDHLHHTIHTHQHLTDFRLARQRKQVFFTWTVDLRGFATWELMNDWVPRYFYVIPSTPAEFSNPTFELNAIQGLVPSCCWTLVEGGWHGRLPERTIN